MHKLKFALKFIIAIIPFSFLGITLYSLFPKIPHLVVILLYTALFAFFVYIFYQKKKKIRESNEDYVIPEYLKPSTLAYLLIAAIMSFFFTSSKSGCISCKASVAIIFLNIEHPIFFPKIEFSINVILLRFIIDTKEVFTIFAMMFKIYFY